jgi:catechol 2,3-dioxygenase-like lactoylglutathione lyase family enzyme
MGWRLRRDDGTQATLDIGTWGSAVFKKAAGSKAVVASICWVIAPWDKQKVQEALKARSLTPIPEDDAEGFESFHVRDPNGFDLQLSNGNGLARTRKTAVEHPQHAPGPFPATGWQTVWLDHLSYNAANYKQAASFYANLLGWKETYDEGSQHELLIDTIGNIIIRGGNPSNPTPSPRANRDRIDHISFGITPWDTYGVQRELERRKLTARIDTSTKDDIHVAAYKSYHTTTPNGFNLQISYVTQENRLALGKTVKPKQ